jgi:hypothetical protein
VASINVDLNYFDHIKTMRLVARLGPGSDVLPIKLWTHVGKHNPSGGSVAMLEAELEHILGWWGEKGALAKAFIEIGFVTNESGKWFVHDWLEHSGHLAYFKKRAEKAARKRWGIKRNSSNASSIAKGDVKQCPIRSIRTVLAEQANWFEKLWVEYPQNGRVRKKEALQRFAASVPDVTTAQRCVVALENYIGSKRVKSGYVQNAPTWFGDWQSWENYREESNGTVNS